VEDLFVKIKVNFLVEMKVDIRFFFFVLGW